MRNRYKTIFSRLLVLVMLTSSFQGTLANDFSQSLHEEESSGVQLLLSDMIDMEVGIENLMDHDNENASHIDCTAQCYVSFLYASNVALPARRSKLLQKLVTDSSAFSSRFPNLLIRPPKI